MNEPVLNKIGKPFKRERNSGFIPGDFFVIKGNQVNIPKPIMGFFRPFFLKGLKEMMAT